MSKTVWITRTQPAAYESAEAWRAVGVDTLVFPLLRVEAVAHPELDDEIVLIFTSKNGVDHVNCQGQRAVCVGDATAAHARDAGFKNVVSVDGASADVTRWVLENLPVSQRLCHVSGWHVRGSITEDLRAASYSADRIKVYRSRPTQAWPDRKFDRVALYSPMAAEVFAKNSMGRDLSEMTALCISKNTAKPLDGLGLKDIIISKYPREDALIHAAPASSI